MAASTGRDDIDLWLEAVGPLGRYSLTQFFILMSVFWPVAINMFSIVFQAQHNHFRCRSPTENITLPSDLSNTSDLYPSNCHVTYIPRYINGHQTNTSVTESCDVDKIGYHYDKSMSFISEFDLVCDREYLVGLSQTLLTLGNLIGAFVFPFFSDRFGRKPVLIVSCVLGLGSSIGLAASNSYDMLVAMKFLLGFLYQGAESAGVGALAEILVTRHRAAFFGFGGAFNWALASVVLAPIAYILRDYSWRSLQIAVSCFSINIILLIFVFDETLRWLSVNGHHSKFKEILLKACRWNKIDFQKVSDEYEAASKGEEKLHAIESQSQETSSVSALHDEKLNFFHLFTDPMLRKHTIFCILSWFFNSLIYFALTLMSNTLHGSLYINYTLSILIEIPASLYCFFFLDKVGRRKSFAILSVIGGGSLIFMGVVWHVNPENSGLILGLTCLGKFAVTGSYTVLYLYAPELFPTNLRSMGMGMGFISSRLGGMLAPFAELLMNQVIYAPGILFGISSLVLSVTPYFLPETTGRQLPQTLHEMKQWR